MFYGTFDHHIENTKLVFVNFLFIFSINKNLFFRKKNSVFAFFFAFLLYLGYFLNFN